MDKIFDCIIIGAGPAGLGAAIYAARAGMETAVIEKTAVFGGQIINTTEVDNYLGLPGIGGYELGESFRKHAQSAGTVFYEDEVTEIEKGEVDITIKCHREKYRSKTVILAMGAHHSKIGVPGENEYIGRGVSYCATCDGAFFRGRDVAVIGGGEVAAADALYLSGICRHVYLIHRRDSLRVSAATEAELKKRENIEILWNTVAQEIKGNDLVENLEVKNVLTGESNELAVSGVFVAVGMEPETGIVKSLVDCDPHGYIIAGEDCITSVPGIFAAGDIRTKALRQVITAVSDGANAVKSIEEYVKKL